MQNSQLLGATTMFSGSVRLPVMVVLCVLFAACGGGGGGGDSGGTSSNTPGSGSGSGGGGAASDDSDTGDSDTSDDDTPDIPQDPAQVPAVNYAGNSSTAVLTDQSVSTIADTLYSGIMLSLFVADEIGSITLPNLNVFDETFSGPEGGTLRVTGRVDDTGRGWIQYDLTDFGDEGFVLNGTQVFRRLEINDGQQPALTEVRLVDLRSQSSFGDITLRGTITNSSTIEPDQSDVTGTIQFTDNNSQMTFLAENISLSRLENSSLDWTIDAQGRLYHGQYGWVDFSLQTPWVIPSGESFPLFGGPLVATTDTGTFLEIETLNAEFVSLQYTTAPDILPDRAARLIWPLYFEVQTNQVPTGAPIADAGASLYAPSGEPIAINGAYSSHPQTNYQDFEWELWFRPPGSEAELDSINAVQPTITLDREGRYLYRLRTASGSLEGTDFVVLTADDETTNPLGNPRAQLPPDIMVGVNEPVPADLTRFTAESVDGPIGSVLNLTEFVPDYGNGGYPGSRDAGFQVPGTYVYVLSYGSLSLSGTRPIDFQTVFVDEERRFAPAVTFPVPEDAGSAVLGDLNGDGLDDLVFAHAVESASDKIAVYFANGSGFNPPQALIGGAGGPVQLGDVSADGRADIVTTTPDGISVYVQQPDGTFSTEVLYAGGCNFDIRPRPLLIADITGDGENDVITDGTCSDSIEIYAQLANGTLGAVGQIASPGGDANVAVGDLNGDDFPDLAVAAEDGSLPGQESIRIHYGDSSGDLSAPDFVAAPYFQNEPPAIRVQDLNADGRDDLIFSVWQEFPVMRQIVIFHQTVDGDLVQSQAIDVSATALTTHLDILDIEPADIDRDGLPDLVLDAIGYGLIIFFQQPDHLFEVVPSRSALYYAGGRAPAEAIGDVNGDGFPDIAFVNGGELATLLLGAE